MAFPTTGILDDFNRANEGPPPSADWTNIVNGCKVVSNICVGGTSGANNINKWNKASYGPDCEIYATLSNFTNWIDLYARFNSAFSNGYGLTIWDVNILRVNKITGGTPTQIGSDITLPANLAAGDSLGMEIIGNDIKVYTKQGGGAWTLRGTVTDSTYTGAGYLGININGTSQQIDDFGGGTVAAAILKTVSDAGSGTDALAIAALLAVSESGHGADGLGSLGAAVPVSDVGSGTDAPKIAVRISIAETGHGADAISVLTALLKIVSDIGSGADAPKISVSLSIPDAGQGIDLPKISAVLVISDAGHGSDAVSILTALLKIVSDAAHGSDSLAISVRVPVSDSGGGLDAIGLIGVLLKIMESGHGLDSITVTGAGVIKYITATFSGKKPGADFACKEPGAGFVGKTPDTGFAGKKPGADFAGKKPGTGFDPIN
jgi:hypothetical protein